MHHTHHMHHTSISIDMLGKHIATMLRHNPYSLLHSTARTNLVARSYPQFFFNFFFCLILILNFCFFLVFSFVSHFVFFLSSLSLWTPLTNPWIQVLKLRSTAVSKIVVIRCENRCQPIEATRQNHERHDTRCKFLDDNLAMNRIPCYVIPLSLVQTS